MFSGCGNPIADQGPSSVTQLPILTALHARYPTLFLLIIHDPDPNVNTFLKKVEKISCMCRFPKDRTVPFAKKCLKDPLDNRRKLC